MAEYRALIRGCGGLVAVGVSLMTVTACGSGSSESQPSGASTRSVATGTSTPSAATSSGAADGPIGNRGIDLGSGGSPTSFPASMLSQDLAKDCYAGGDRIYDRYGITCADAQRVLRAYEVTAASKTGEQSRVESYDCSHNPSIMVNQGAAPGKCVNAEGDVVFNWRYPGAPLPAQS